MKFLLVTIGTGGDVHPFIALARALNDAGHETLLVVNDHFAPRANAVGVRTHPLGEPWDPSSLASVPDLLHPRRGPKTVFEDLILPAVPDIVGATRSAVASFRPDAVVSHHIAMGVPWVCREMSRSRVPWASVLLSPIAWLSRDDANVYPPVLPRWVLGALGGAKLPLLRTMTRLSVDPKTNRVRRSLGLPPVRGHIYQHASGADLHLAMWSPALRAPAGDDPPRTRVCGFAIHDDAGPSANTDAEHQEAVLARVLPRRPIVFAIGTAAVHIERGFFEHAAEVCARLGRPGLLLTGDERHAPASLPDGVEALPYAPFGRVFPSASAIVHHGGAGSTAQALRSGVPTLVTPFCNDGFDWAARAERLGVARVLPRTHLDTHSLEGALEGLLENERIAARSKEIARAVIHEHGARAAAGHLERWVGSGSSASRESQAQFGGSTSRDREGAGAPPKRQDPLPGGRGSSESDPANRT